MKSLRIVLGCWFLLFGYGFADPVEDLSPPDFVEAPTVPAPTEPETYQGLIYHAAPKPLHPEAITSDWPRYLGPDDNATSPETHLLAKFPAPREDAQGPNLVWERRKGNGYTSPVIVGDRLYYFHRVDDEEVTECLSALDGRRYWMTQHPVEYRDRYGFSNGPRCSPVVAGDRVFTYGVTGILTCLDAASGTQLWQRDLQRELASPEYFFGYGPTPIVFEDKVIVNLGARRGNLAVVAFSTKTGELVWGTPHEWRASYASPRITEMHGKPTLFVLAGGESDPAVGGLLAIDPTDGTLYDAFPWRAPKYESVNGQTPVFLGDNRVYVSDAYEIGGVCLEFTAEGNFEELWRAPGFGFHWTMPILHEGHLYGFRGRNEPDAWLACYDIATGTEQWQDIPEWQRTYGGRNYTHQYFRGNILKAEGRGYVLGELGDFGIMKFDPTHYEEIDHAHLFFARSTWSPPALSKGLLYLVHHEPDMDNGTGPRILCYDLRGE